MICPQCGARNELGARRCSACLCPFTRSALRQDARFAPAQASGVHGPARTGAWPEDEPARDRPEGSGTTAAHLAVPRGAYDSTRSRSRGAGRGTRGCLSVLLAAIVATGALIVLALVISSLVVKPMVRRAAIGDVREGVRSEVAGQIATYVTGGEALDGAPDGEITITQDEINQRIAEVPDLGPLDDVGVTIADDGIDVSLHAYGLSGSYHAALRAENGTLVLDGGGISGPLGMLVPAGDLERAVNEEIAAALFDAGYHIDTVTVADQALILRVNRE